MADYNQQNQRVNRQYNASGDIHYSQRQTNNQQGQSVENQYNAGRDVNAQRYMSHDRHDQHIQYQESIGRDKIQVAHVHNNATPASSVLTCGVIIVVVLLLLGAGVYFAYPPLKSLAQHMFSTVPQNTGATKGIVPQNTGATDPQQGLDSTLYGTPKGSLNRFCQLLQSGDLQGAYDDYSDHLQSQTSLSDFTNMWGQPGEAVTSCLGNIINTSGTSATGTLNIRTETVNHGDTTSSAAYNITLVSSNGIWRIDTMVQQ